MAFWHTWTTGPSVHCDKIIKICVTLTGDFRQYYGKM